MENEKDGLQKKQIEIRKSIIEQYIKYRKLKNLTQEELAREAGMKRPGVSRFESGQYNPTLDMLVKLADGMNLEIEISLRSREETEDGNEEK